MMGCLEISCPLDSLNFLAILSFVCYVKLFQGGYKKKTQRKSSDQWNRSSLEKESCLGQISKGNKSKPLTNLSVPGLRAIPGKPCRPLDGRCWSVWTSEDNYRVDYNQTGRVIKEMGTRFVWHGLSGNGTCNRVERMWSRVLLWPTTWGWNSGAVSLWHVFFKKRRISNFVNYLNSGVAMLLEPDWWTGKVLVQWFIGRIGGLTGSIAGFLKHI